MSRAIPGERARSGSRWCPEARQASLRALVQPMHGVATLGARLRVGRVRSLSQVNPRAHAGHAAKGPHDPWGGHGVALQVDHQVSRQVGEGLLRCALRRPDRRGVRRQRRDGRAGSLGALGDALHPRHRQGQQGQGERPVDGQPPSGERGPARVGGYEVQRSHPNPTASHAA